MKKREVKSRKEELIEIIIPLAEQSRSLRELGDRIKQKSKLTPYYRRGLLTGIIDGNQKYRLRRLGISIEKVQELTIEELRLRNLKQQQRHKEQNRDREQGKNFNL